MRRAGCADRPGLAGVPWRRIRGKIVFDADTCPERLPKAAIAVILVRIETSPEDIHGMHAAQAAS